jgi:transposase
LINENNLKSFIKNKELGAIDKTIFLYAILHEENGIVAMPSAKEIKTELQIGRTNYYNSIKNLREKGYLFPYQERKNGRYSTVKHKILKKFEDF